MKKKRTFSQPLFCTQCSENLEEFCFSPKLGNLDLLRAAALRCTATGVRRGRVCAKLFIAEDERLATMLLNPGKRSSPRTRERLRRVILKKIRDEAGREKGGP
jgi:hypothetical protein